MITYYAVYVKDDLQPVILCKYKSTADGFVQIYDKYKVKYRIEPIQIELASVRSNIVLDNSMVRVW